MRKLMLLCVGIAGLSSSTGCVVDDRPRPVVYAYPVYPVYGPDVVIVRGGYCGGGYYHRGWR